MHNCVYFLPFLFPMNVLIAVICKAYSIQNVLISIINDWVLTCIECIESAELKMKKIKG